MGFGQAFRICFRGVRVFSSHAIFLTSHCGTDLSISKVKAASKQSAQNSSAQASKPVAKTAASPSKSASSPVQAPRGGRQVQPQSGANDRRNRRPNGESSQSQDLVDYLDKALKEKDMRRAHVGIEYECPLGHRQFASPELIATAMGFKAYVKGGKVDLERLLSEQELPMFLPCACGKPNAFAQLLRIYFVTPEGASPLKFGLNPIVQFSIPNTTKPASTSQTSSDGENAAPTMSFHLGSQVVVSAAEHSVSVIRFPLIYSTPRKSLIQTSPNAPYHCCLLPNAIKPI